MTSKEIEEVEKRCMAAQNGPWTSYIEGRDHTSGSSFIMIGVGENRSDRDVEIFGITIEEQDFIASARQDIPRLIEEVKILRSRISTSE